MSSFSAGRADGCGRRGPRSPGALLRLAALGFVAGVCAFHLLPAPLAPWIIGLALPPALLLAWWRPGWPALPLFLWLGFGWAEYLACPLLCSPFPDELARVPLVVEGRIASIPAEHSGATRFQFRLERTLRDGRPLAVAGLVRLSWYRCDQRLTAGERWRLTVRLKPPHGYANPGGFDAERWLFEQGVMATGYVQDKTGALRLDPGPGPDWLTRWRQSIAEHLEQVLGEHHALALVQALTIGETSGFERQDWETFTRTGTSHLIAISGLNVGLIAGVCMLLVRWSWSRSARLCLLLAAPRAAAVAGLLAAIAYSGLAGFSVSTQRALVMLAVVLAALYWQRALQPYHALLVALTGVLLFDPGSVLAFGFWLSFVAVAVLLFNLGQRLPRHDLWTKWGRAQWAVTIGLLPLLLLLFGWVSTISPLVNLLAVPLFGVLLPLVLIAALLSLVPWLDWPLHLTADLLGWSMDALGRVAAAPWAVTQLPAQPLWVWALSAVGCGLLLAPRGLPGRWLGLVMLLPLVWHRPPAPGQGEVWFSLLDVGQGLAAVARTRDGTLVFDTGPSFSGGFDTGSQVVAPFLASQGIGRIERLVLSHADRDHAGGATGLLRRIRAEHILSGEPGALDLPGAEPCLAGDAWVWSGVSFRFLHPEQMGAEGNDASCVLRIATPGAAILLTGDAGTKVERALVARDGDRLRSTILVAGHHGSTTSSSAEFLRAVAPDWVLFSAGYANRFGFPAAEVRQRVAALGIRTLDTATDGAILIRLGPDGIQQGPEGWRSRSGWLWTHRPGE